MVADGRAGHSAENRFRSFAWNLASSCHIVTRGRTEEFNLQRHDVGSWQRGEKILLADRLSVAERPLLVEEAAEEEQPGDQGGGQQCEGAPCAHPARGGRGQGGEGGGEEGQHDLRPDDSATDERKFL